MNPRDWQNLWAGQTAICIASGPSLTEADCETAQASGRKTIVTNTTFKLCPWADVLFGFDGKWWRKYAAEVDQVFKGERVTCSIAGKSMGITSMHQESWFQHFHNSGAAAISLAATAGAKRIVLLGYDCQKTEGKTHWHGDHPKDLGNAHSLPRWPRHFASVAKHVKTQGAEVINCSRATALTCFPRMELAAAL